MENRNSNEAANFFGKLQAWSLTFPQVSAELRSEIIVDLDGLYDSLSNVLRALDRLIAKPAREDSLETFLVDADIEFAHLAHHWQGLLRTSQGMEIDIRPTLSNILPAEET